MVTCERKLHQSQANLIFASFTKLEQNLAWKCKHFNKHKSHTHEHELKSFSKVCREYSRSSRRREIILVETLKWPFDKITFYFPFVFDFRFFHVFSFFTLHQNVLSQTQSQYWWSIFISLNSVKLKQMIVSPINTNLTMPDRSFSNVRGWRDVVTLG